MKKIRIRSLLGIVICAAALLFSGLQISAIGKDLQYIVPAPRMEPSQPDQTGDGGSDSQQETPPPAPNQAAKALWESLQTAGEDWSGSMSAYTLSGIMEKASFTSDTQETKQARLTALGENAFTLEPKYLRFGRLFYPEELKKGADIILLDEQLALALFKISEPIDRTVTLNGKNFRVIGILRHTKRVGDSEDYGAYIPLACVWDKEIQLQALQVSARPIPGAGARSKFASSMESWQAGGTLIDLGKEAMGALLPLRVLLFFLGSVVFFRLLGWWNGWFRRFFEDYRSRLVREYAVRLMPRLTLGIIGLALGYGGLALGAATLIEYIVAPVYTFTEWVPAVLVEWKDIQTAFWQVWQSAARLTELRSPEFSRIRFFAMIVAWASAGAAVSLTALWLRGRQIFHEKASKMQEKAHDCL